MGGHEEILNLAWRNSSRRIASNDRAWAAILSEKSRQVEELSTAIYELLLLCANSEDTVDIEEVYRILSPVRQL